MSGESQFAPVYHPAVFRSQSFLTPPCSLDSGGPRGGERGWSLCAPYHCAPLAQSSAGKV